MSSADNKLDSQVPGSPCKQGGLQHTTHHP